MIATYLSCAVCGVDDTEALYPALLSDGSESSFQRIVICRQCGLVYKNPVVPSENGLVYAPGSWPQTNIFRQRLEANADFIATRAHLATGDAILDVGPGPGFLMAALRERYPSSKIFGLEAVPEVAALAARQCRGAVVLPGSVDEASFPANRFKLMAVCGVDYLFADHRGALEKLSRWLANDGWLYIERNVFVDQQAYTAADITSLDTLFGSNPLMTTWFHRDQYREYLDCMFEVVESRRYDSDVTSSGRRNTLDGHLCRKRVAPIMRTPRSYYEENRAHVEALRARTPPRPQRTASPDAAQPSLHRVRAMILGRVKSAVKRALEP